MKERLGKRVLTLCLSFMMLLQMMPGLTLVAHAGLPERSAQKLENVISSVKIVNHVGTEYVPDENGLISLYYGIRNRYQVEFDLTNYDNNLVNGDYFTFTIPAPIPIENGTIAFTDPTTGIQIATGTVVSNGEYNGGVATVTLQNLEEYLAKTSGETIQDVKGTFYVDFKISREMTETTIEFETDETVNKITHKFQVVKVEETDQSDRIGETNFEKRLNTTSATPFESEALGKTIDASASWYGRINVRQASYDKIVITDTIDIEEHAPMQFIPELLELRTGYFGSNYEFVYDDYNTPLVKDVDYTVEYNENYTEFVLTINNASSITDNNGNPAAFWLSYSTTITNDGTAVYNAMKVSADDQVLTEKTTNTKTEAIQETSVKTTSGGTITIDTSYSIVLYKVDEESMKPLEGAVFKVILPNGDEVELAATDEDGRTQSRQFTSAEVAGGEFTIVEVTSPNGYKLDTTPITVTLGEEGVVRTITNKPLDASGSIALEASKELTGRDLNAGEFTFTVTEDGKEVATGKNDASGNIEFSEIEYSREDVGTHTYTISEVKGTLGGVDYDENTFTVTVEVTNNGDGTLTATATYPTDGVKFENTYKAAEIPVPLEAMKSLDGAELQADQFSFTLKDEDGELVEEVTNDAEGIVKFQDLVFTEAGVYVYTVSEVQGDEEGITYDETIYNVTITVTDDLNGNLVASVDTEDKDLVFSNKYTPKDTDDEEDEDENDEDDEDAEDSDESSSPETGDDNNLFGWVAVILASAIAFSGMIFKRRRQDR